MIAPNRVVARLPGRRASTNRSLGNTCSISASNLTGRLRMKLAASTGTEITFLYYASHTGDRDNLTENFRQSDRYICRGGPDEEFCSQFNWRAFRFVKVSGLPHARSCRTQRPN